MCTHMYIYTYVKQLKQNLMCNHRLSRYRLLLEREHKRKFFEFGCSHSTSIDCVPSTHYSSH